MSEPSRSEPIRSMEQYMRRFFPKEYAKRKAEGCCIHCGARKAPSPFKGKP